jgi:aspartate/methionine/tyrosine aminotransferase
VFSSRVPANVVTNRLTEALQARRSSGQPFIDLTESNPTGAGFDYPPDLLTPLGDARGLRYAPSPFGTLDARRCVAADYARQGISVDPHRIVLAASTSDAYSLLFKLLADAGDEVLVPRPSYPLFDHLTRLDLVVTREYALDIDGSCSIGLRPSARRAASRSSRTRSSPTTSWKRVRPAAPAASPHAPTCCRSRSAACRNRSGCPR